MGTSPTITAENHAFLYTNGQMQDLNELVNLPPGVSLINAYGINYQGWIVGTTSSGHAYLLTTNQAAFPAILYLLLDYD